jgi:hypothetical protein
MQNWNARIKWVYLWRKRVWRYKVEGIDSGVSSIPGFDFSTVKPWGSATTELIKYVNSVTMKVTEVFSQKQLLHKISVYINNAGYARA